jgi:hypothetical protein
MHVRVSGRFIVFVHGIENPSDEDWNGAMRLLGGLLEHPNPGCLVFTLGAAPNAAQRARLKQVTGDRTLRIALLTPSSTARTVGVAIRWFNPEFRAFEPNALDAALDHLGASADERRRVRQLLGELKGELDSAETDRKLPRT